MCAVEWPFASRTRISLLWLKRANGCARIAAASPEWLQRLRLASVSESGTSSTMMWKAVLVNTYWSFFHSNVT